MPSEPSPTTHDAEAAVKQLTASGFDAGSLSVIGKGYHTEEKVLGFYNTGDRIKIWGSQARSGAASGACSSAACSSASPITGPVLFLGYLGSVALTAIESAVVVGGAGAIVGALFSIGIPKDSVVRYDAAIKADNFLVMVHGDADQVPRPRPSWPRRPRRSTSTLVSPSPRLSSQRPSPPGRPPRVRRSLPLPQEASADAPQLQASAQADTRTKEIEMQFPRFVKALVTSVLLALSVMPAMSDPAAAQDMNATVIVPDAPGGARFTVCYNVAQRLYGPYRMEFCLDQRGTYTVTGRGVTCNGRLDWSARGRTIEIDLRRTSCGNGVAWSADSMSCQGASLFGKGGVAGAIGGALAKVIVPGIPTLSSLNCTYYPAVRNEAPTTITARRVS
ncbi:MAG: hypothetical protein WDN31_11640 [Hyphomicrobium sp.]